MKPTPFIYLTPLLLFLGSCAVSKINRSDTYKWSVATVEKPKAKVHTENKPGSGVHHYSVVSFSADSAGQNITIKEEYNAKENAFLYQLAKAGDQFAVRYDSLNPHHYKVYSNKPRLGAVETDSTGGRITKIVPLEGYVEYTYFPKGKDSTKNHTVINTESVQTTVWTPVGKLHKTQDIRTDSIGKLFPIVKKDSVYTVIYNKSEPARSYIIIGDSTGYITLRTPDPKPLHRKNVKTTTHHSTHKTSNAIPISAFMAVNVLPIESLRVGFSLQLYQAICVGIDASLVYKNQYAQAGHTNGTGGLTNLFYPHEYFSLDKNLFILNPYIKCYVYHQKDRPGAGVYIRGGYSLTSLIANMRSDYYNKEGIPMDTVSDSFIAMDAAHNKVLTTTSSFKTNGFNASIGGSFYLGEQKHWLMDIGIGYNYLKLPGGVTQSRVFNNETYYYHISPIWRNPIDFQLFMQWSIMYKF